MRQSYWLSRLCLLSCLHVLVEVVVWIEVVACVGC